jgi:hypothetical protein
MLRLTSLLLVPLVALACGGSVTSSQAGGTTSGSGGSGTATSSAASSSSSSTGTVGQGGSTGAGGNGACGTIELTVDNGAPRHYAANCAGSDPTESSFTTAIGYVSASPVQHTEWLTIVGCASAAAGAEGITLTAQDASGSGTYAMGTTQFTDAQGAVWGMASDPFDMVVTTWAATIDGTFSVTATKGGVAHALAGQFHVCHGADFLPP